MPMLIQLLNDRIDTGAILMVLLAARSTLYYGVSVVYQKNGKSLCCEVTRNHLALDLGNVRGELTYMAAAPHA